MRDRMFESCLMKKDTDQSRIEIREKLRAAVNNRSEIFNKSKEEKTQLTKNLSLFTIGVSGDQITQSKQIN
ncbi:MAG: hypothetical protein O3C54_05660, partial [Proteobacteria bacterium]|nr:hypothetical protein [Pseudomonadota bacterium]